jgi:hypothetical protein
LIFISHSVISKDKTVAEDYMHKNLTMTQLKLLLLAADSLATACGTIRPQPLTGTPVLEENVESPPTGTLKPTLILTPTIQPLDADDIGFLVLITGRAVC